MFFDVWEGFDEMLMAMILGCAAQQAHFCYILCYFFLAVYSLLTYVSFVGLAVQNSISGSGLNFSFFYNSTTFYAYEMTMSIIMIVFLVFAIVVCFYAYREFKAIFFDHVGLGNGIIPSMGMGQPR
mmetsp:Transcript_885/g.528  ORF Transcript_885/g.528 Transcript_885/m.528 type:complete len:126 (+) Transcript_885:132-509(+)